MKTPTKTTPKTLMLSIGAKGGTGKTITMLGIADYLAANNRPFTPLDCDHENRSKVSSFANVFPEDSVARPDLRSEADCDKLLNTTAESESGLVLADLPANSGSDFLAWWGNACASEYLAELNVRVIMVGVITPEPATFGAIADWARVLQGSVSYLIALNRRSSIRAMQPLEELMPDYFASATGESFRTALKPSAVEIPALNDISMAAMLRSGTLPSIAKVCPSIKALDRGRISTWVTKLHANLAPVLGEQFNVVG